MEVTGNKGVVYEFGKFVLDPGERTLLVDGVPVHLPAKEFDTLLLLVEHNGHALSKEEMMSAIWQDSFVEESNLAKQISRLRKILNTDGEHFIETLPKHGYRFTAAKLRRALIEPEDDIIFEKRIVKRVTFAVENDQDEPLKLPPARRNFFSRLTVPIAIGLIAVGLLAWFFRKDIFLANAKVVDPYEPIRLTDNPNDDTGPQWTRDGRVRFYRVYSDRHSEMWTMNADGSDQTLIKDPEGKKIFSWSPDGQKVIFQKLQDPTATYLSNADGSNEVVMPMRGGEWSADSKMLVYMKRISGDDLDIFTYSLETGKIQNLTNDPALDADPSFSFDGKQIVFDSDRDGNQEIYLMNADGSGLRRLTFNIAGDAHPAFSPDGTEIIFTSNRDSEDADVYVMNADGSNQTKLVGWDKSNETAGAGAWSPDGTKIAFFSDRNGGHDDIYLISAETIRPKLVLSDAGHDLTSPSYSPDGNKIVYSRELDDKSGELRIYDLGSNRSMLIKNTTLPTSMPRWSPDGQRIAFYDRVEGNSEIFSIKPDGSDLHRLTTDPSIDAEPSWSPDGSKIVFETGRGAPLGKPQLYIMNADGSDQRPLTPQKGWEGNASWSPDGSSILFACDREDSPGNMLDICEINADGSGEKHVLYHRDQDTYPAVSPDGKRIVFVASSDGNQELYLMNRDGSGLLRLTRDSAADDFPQWSPDGAKIIFSSNRGEKIAIYEIEKPQ